MKRKLATGLVSVVLAVAHLVLVGCDNGDNSGESIVGPRLVVDNQTSQATSVYVNGVRVVVVAAGQQWSSPVSVNDHVRVGGVPPQGEADFQCYIVGFLEIEVRWSEWHTLGEWRDMNGQVHD